MESVFDAEPDNFFNQVAMRRRCNAVATWQAFWKSAFMHIITGFGDRTGQAAEWWRLRGSPPPELLGS
jgi:hypothetical protein